MLPGGLPESGFYMNGVMKQFIIFLLRKEKEERWEITTAIYANQRGLNQGEQVRPLLTLLGKVLTLLKKFPTLLGAIQTGLKAGSLSNLLMLVTCN